MELIILLTLCIVAFPGSHSIKITNLTDQLRCKLTHKGLSFIGHVSKTDQGIRCQYWADPAPMHNVSDTVKDEGFPENSKQKAKNFCRNPTDLEAGPWCYTLDRTVSDENCGIPLCRHTYCRMTGPGMEYAGEAKHSASGEECLKWTKKRKTKNDVKTFRFDNKLFPSGYRSDAKHFCRNPDGNVAGPWCYVERESKGFDDEIVKQLCDAPFCNEPDCVVYSASSPTNLEYSHFSRLKPGHSNISLSLKLWNPDEWRTAKVYLLLSVIPTPGGPTRGVEIMLSNNLTGATTGTKDAELNPSHQILSGNHWSRFSITWTNGFIAVNRESAIRPLFLGEYTESNTRNKTDDADISSGLFQYYSIAGDSILWSLPFCRQDCEEHVTSHLNFTRFWHLKITPTGREVTVFVRGRHNAVIELRVSPRSMYPQVWLVFQGDRNMTSVVYREVEGSGVTLKEVRTEAILEYWEWRKFTISIFGNKLNIFWVQDDSINTILEVADDRIRPFCWFSMGSRESVTHWTLFCTPADIKTVSLSLPPECVTLTSDVDYSGTQWSSHTGRPCIPWVDSPSHLVDNLFIDNSRKAAQNYCRNPTSDPLGAFCFVLNSRKNKVKEYCEIRKCRSSECRMAGTGNDYIGMVKETRSGRSCQKWTTNTPHKVNQTYLDDDLFPDIKFKDALNHCRNPSRNIMGSWCYTTDPLVVRDGCDVKDCDKAEECTVMTRGTTEGRLIYILPAWRGFGLRFWLKNWDPDKLDGIVFTLRSMDAKQFYRLIIGDDAFEKVKLFYSNGKDKQRLMKHKTLPRLIPVGKWAGFWLSMQEGKVRFGMEGIESSLFEWSTDKKEEIFLPMFFSFMSLTGNTVGVHFLCHECHIERTTTTEYDKILPLNLWSPDHVGPHRNLTLHLRGNGSALVPLMQLPGRSNFFGLVIGKDNDTIFFVRQIGHETTTLKTAKTKTRLIEHDKWAKFHISFNETHISVSRDGTLLLLWESTEPMIFYWFSVGAESGTIIWAANCQPTDIDGAPRDGGWSAWGPYDCSVTCGGGVGKQTRTCTNPEPNIFGRQCNGSDTMEGTCNTFKCGEISPDTTEMLIYQLQTKGYSYEVLQGDNVTIDMSDIEAFKRIQIESPKATWDWSKDGGPINKSRGEVHNGTLILSRVIPEDSGVYACVLRRITKQRMVLKLVTVAVTPAKPNLSTRVTWSMTLTCNNLILGYIYSDLSQMWLLNGKMWKDYGITTLEAVNSESISKVKKSHEGIWKCVISQNDLGFSWVTNVVYVEVKKAPSLLTYLMEDETTARFFKPFGSDKLVGAFLVFLVVLTIIVAVCMVYVYANYCQLPEPNLTAPTVISPKQPKKRVSLGTPSTEASDNSTDAESVTDEEAPLVPSTDTNNRKNSYSTDAESVTGDPEPLYPVTAGPSLTDTSHRPTKYTVERPATDSLAPTATPHYSPTQNSSSPNDRPQRPPMYKQKDSPPSDSDMFESNSSAHYDHPENDYDVPARSAIPPRLPPPPTYTSARKASQNYPNDIHSHKPIHSRPQDNAIQNDQSQKPLLPTAHTRKYSVGDDATEVEMQTTTTQYPSSGIDSSTRHSPPQRPPVPSKYAKRDLLAIDAPGMNANIRPARNRTEQLINEAKNYPPPRPPPPTQHDSTQNEREMNKQKDPAQHLPSPPSQPTQNIPPKRPPPLTAYRRIDSTDNDTDIYERVVPTQKLHSRLTPHVAEILHPQRPPVPIDPFQNPHPRPTHAADNGPPKRPPLPTGPGQNLYPRPTNAAENGPPKRPPPPTGSAQNLHPRPKNAADNGPPKRPPLPTGPAQNLHPRPTHAADNGPPKRPPVPTDPAQNLNPRPTHAADNGPPKRPPVPTDHTQNLHPRPTHAADNGPPKRPPLPTVPTQNLHPRPKNAADNGPPKRPPLPTGPTQNLHPRPTHAADNGPPKRPPLLKDNKRIVSSPSNSATILKPQALAQKPPNASHNVPQRRPPPPPPTTASRRIDNVEPAQNLHLPITNRLNAPPQRPTPPKVHVREFAESNDPTKMSMQNPSTIRSPNKPYHLSGPTEKVPTTTKVNAQTRNDVTRNEISLQSPEIKSPRPNRSAHDKANITAKHKSPPKIVPLRKSPLQKIPIVKLGDDSMKQMVSSNTRPAEKSLTENNESPKVPPRKRRSPDSTDRKTPRQSVLIPEDHRGKAHSESIAGPSKSTPKDEIIKSREQKGITPPKSTLNKDKAQDAHLQNVHKKEIRLPKGPALQKTVPARKGTSDKSSLRETAHTNINRSRKSTVLTAPLPEIKGQTKKAPHRKVTKMKAPSATSSRSGSPSNTFMKITTGTAEKYSTANPPTQKDQKFKNRVTLSPIKKSASNKKTPSEKAHRGESPTHKSIDKEVPNKSSPKQKPPVRTSPARPPKPKSPPKKAPNEKSQAPKPPRSKK